MGLLIRQRLNSLIMALIIMIGIILPVLNIQADTFFILYITCNLNLFRLRAASISKGDEDKLCFYKGTQFSGCLSVLPKSSRNDIWWWRSRNRLKLSGHFRAYLGQTRNLSLDSFWPRWTKNDFKKGPIWWPTEFSHFSVFVRKSTKNNK